MSNPTESYQVIRTAFDVTKWNANVAPTDITTGATLQLAIGADLLWNMIFSVGALADGTILNPSNLTSIIVALQDSNAPHETTSYWAQTILNAAIGVPGAGSPTLNTANWNNGSAQQISLSVANSVWNTLIQSGQNTFWVCIYGITTDSPAKNVPLAFFQVLLFDTGMPVTNPLASPTVLGYQSFLCSDGLYRRMTISPEGSVEVINPAGSSSP
jgi:hypothetical protein